MSKYEIDFGNELPGGYVLESTRVEPPGGNVLVSTRGFSSTADGHWFIRLLEEFPAMVLSKLPRPHLPSQIDNMLVVISPTGATQVYINETNTIMSTRVRRTVKAGQAVSLDDISDIGPVELESVDVPNDAGILFFFSFGWRRGLFYDFGPLGGKEKQPRQYDLARVLGSVYGQVMFQERFSISEAEWQALFKEQWFLFNGLPHTLLDSMIRHVQANWSVDDLLEKVAEEVRQQAHGMLSSWRRMSAFGPHLEIVETAINHFLNGDYVSCTSLLYPRIEGILRTHHRSIRPPVKGKPTSSKLASSAVAAKRDDLEFQSLVLPERFETYLNQVYFRSFKPDDSEIEVSRHSVSHGEVPVEKLNLKSSVVSILIVHQLFYTFES